MNAILYYLAANMAPDGPLKFDRMDLCLMLSCTLDRLQRKKGPALATLVILSVLLVSC